MPAHPLLVTPHTGQVPPVSVALQGGSLLVPVHSSRRKGGAHDLRMPQYLVVGGLVFVPLCEPYLRSEFGDDFVRHSRYRRYRRYRRCIHDSLYRRYIRCRWCIRYRRDIQLGSV